MNPEVQEGGGEDSEVGVRAETGSRARAGDLGEWWAASQEELWE